MNKCKSVDFRGVLLERCIAQEVVGARCIRVVRIIVAITIVVYSMNTGNNRNCINNDSKKH